MAKRVRRAAIMAEGQVAQEQVVAAFADGSGGALFSADVLHATCLAALRNGCCRRGARHLTAGSLASRRLALRARAARDCNSTEASDTTVGTSTVPTSGGDPRRPNCHRLAASTVPQLTSLTSQDARDTQEH
eukprot:15440407-Alexandrium_andersonii.AAC.1